LPGYLIDWCPRLHDPLSPLAGTRRTARVGGVTLTGNRTSACVWSRTDKPFGWKIPDEQSTQWRELLCLSLIVHWSTSLHAFLGSQPRGLRDKQSKRRAGRPDNPDPSHPEAPGMDAGDPASTFVSRSRRAGDPLGLPDTTTWQANRSQLLRHSRTGGHRGHERRQPGRHGDPPRRVGAGGRVSAGRRCPRTGEPVSPSPYASL
jgi:hypothetical protein